MEWEEREEAYITEIEKLAESIECANKEIAHLQEKSLYPICVRTCPEVKRHIAYISELINKQQKGENDGSTNNQ
jgi:hypothetical protein